MTLYEIEQTRLCCSVHRADSVTKKRLIKTGIGKKVMIDDGRQVFVVCNVLSKYYESNWDISNSNRSNEGSVNILDAFDRLNKSKVGNRDKASEGNFLEVIVRVIKVHLTGKVSYLFLELYKMTRFLMYKSRTEY